MCRILLILIAAFTLCMDAHAQDDFYIVNGRPVQLVRSDSAIAVRLQPNEDLRFRGFVNDIPELRIEDIPAMLAEHNILFLRTNEPVTDAARNNAFARIRRSSLVQEEVPAFRSGTVHLLLIDRFKIRFVPDAIESQIESILDDIGARVINSDDRSSDRFVVDFPNRTLDESRQVINDLNNNPIIRYAQPDFVRVYAPMMDTTGNHRQPPEDIGWPDEYQRKGSSVDAACTPNGTSVNVQGLPDDPLFENQWSLRNLGNNPYPGVADADINYTSVLGAIHTPGINIAILDLGVESDHPDLEANIEANVDATGSGDANPQDPSNYHGTAVAGIAAATYNNHKGLTGVAADVGIINVRIAEAACEDCSWIPTNGSDWKGIRYAVTSGAHILVNSWGGGGPDNDIYAEIKDAIDKGRVVVFAAGNHLWEVRYDSMGVPYIYPGENSVQFPASLAITAPHPSVRDGLIAVSATNQFDEFKTHPYEADTSISQDGDTDWGSNRGPAVSLAAPGVYLYTTDNGAAYRCISGTSAAAPLVGGAAAILLHEFPGATPKQIKQWLQLGADKLYLAGGLIVRDDFIGHGRLDLKGALDAASDEIVSNGNQRPNPPVLNDYN